MHFFVYFFFYTTFTNGETLTSDIWRLTISLKVTLSWEHGKLFQGLRDWGLTNSTIVTF